MPQTSLLLPRQPTPLTTLVVAVIAAVAIMAGSLIVIGQAPAEPVAAKARPAATLVACSTVPGGLHCY